MIPPCINALTLITKGKRLLRWLLHNFFFCRERISSYESVLAIEQQQKEKKKEKKILRGPEK